MEFLDTLNLIKKKAWLFPQVCGTSTSIYHKELLAAIIAEAERRKEWERRVEMELRTFGIEITS